MPVEGLDGVLAVPAESVADIVDHRTFTRPVPVWITLAAALQILFLALMAHDPK